MSEKISLEHAHKDKHPKKIDIVVRGEAIDNAIEAEKDKWFSVEAIIPDNKEKTFFQMIYTVNCEDVKIYERE